MRTKCITKIEEDSLIYKCEAFTQEGLEKTIVELGAGHCLANATIVNQNGCSPDCERLRRYKIARNYEKDNGGNIK